MSGMKNRKFFDEITDRTGTHSIKWDRVKEGGLAMWIADMDFRTPHAVTDSIIKRAENGIFGYTEIPDEWYCAYQKWWKDRYNFSINKEWLIFTTGVIPAISSIIRKMTTPAENVVVMTPVYNMFFDSILDNGRNVLESRLVYNDGKYSIDFADLEQKAADPNVKVLLLCNPHNPAGRVWTKQELTRIGDICIRNNVWVVADEIHCELVFPGHTYIPFASISQEFLMHSVTCTSPSKAFNLAGLQIANIISADTDIRTKIDKAINVNEVCDVNPFGVEALMAAYNDSKEWLEELKQYLFANYNYLRAYFAEYLPEFPVSMLEGTYLVWVDCSVLNQSSDEIVKTLLEKEKLWVNEGSLYGEAGEGFIRINIACPRQQLIEGLNRLRRALK